MNNVVTKAINNKRLVDNKKKIVEYISKIKNRLKDLQDQINKQYKENSEIEHLKLKFGIFTFLNNKDRNSLRFIFKPFKVDNGTYLRIGLFSNELKFFDKNGSPFIIPNNYFKLSEFTKDLEDFLHSEKILIELLFEKCKNKESIDNIINMYKLIRDVNILDNSSVELIKGKQHAD